MELEDLKKLMQVLIENEKSTDKNCKILTILAILVWALVLVLIGCVICYLAVLL